jgi:prevent-host-death family protein
MKLSDNVKPLSYLKAKAPQVIRELAEKREPVVITLRGEARAIIQDVVTYEETQETLALLKMLALTSRKVEDGDVAPAKEAFARIRQRVEG